MPHTRPTKKHAGNLTHQRPSPPITRADLLAAAQRHERLQRQNWTSNNYNTLQAVAEIYVDWVMEDEVPAGNHRFLEYPTRRAFIEDRVQLRVQVHNLALVNPKVAIFLYDASRPATEYAAVLVSDAGDAGNLVAAHVPAVHRQKKTRGDIHDLSTARGETAIYVEIDGGSSRSFIATTIVLPAPADPEVVSVTYHARVEIIDNHQTHIGYSPTIEAVRWWARPSTNMTVERTAATTITPRIDGEAFFGRVAHLLGAAVAGDHVYLASWSFNPFTMMTGGQNGPATAAGLAPPDPNGAFADALCGHIRTAIGNGVIVHILLDSHNAPFGEELVTDLKNRNYFTPHDARIEVRSSGHPKHIKVGVGRLATRRRIGSYHEKYVILTGSQHVALIGGIDAEGDRMNPAGHAWRHWSSDYADSLKAHFYNLGAGDHAFVDDLYDGDPHMMWHDVGVEIDGQRAIHDLCLDFIRRWNEGEGDGVALVPPPAPPHPGGERNLQFVKTDRLSQAYNAIPAGHHLGTMDATLQAVREARHYIYMENQYMRDQELANAIADAMRSNTNLVVILVIPFETEEAAQAGNRRRENRTVFWMLKEPGKKIRKIQERASIHGDWLQARFIATLRAVDPARVGVFALAKYVTDIGGMALPEQIYPHAKTMVVDDTWAYIGSANANGRSLKLDGESGYVLHDRATVTAYRQALWQEHLHVAPPDTRAIRAFLTHWNNNAVHGHNHLMTLNQAELANTAAVEIQNPPQGQEYNGPGSWVVNLHDYV